MRQRAAVLGVIAALGLGAPASAQLPAGDAPLPGSAFQGADGDQDDAGSRIDWQAVEAADQVSHGADANGADTAFAGGSSETEPGDWELTTEAGGVTPAKSNIRDAWGAVDQPGADTFLYVGFTREASTGTSFLTFELNRDDRLWDNGHARIPCRRTGDLQISYEPQGTAAVVLIRRWTTTRADPHTGCATSGRLDTFTEVEANVQGAMNDRPIASRLPGAITGTVPSGQFGEASLNLARLVDEAFDDECLAFGSIWMHSRSSDARASSLKDYVAPRALTLRTCSASGVKFFDADADGRRDAGERGIPRFLIWADYDDDGEQDPAEPFSISDDDGRYVIDDIRPPDGTYRLRERLLSGRSRALPAALDWTCSQPATAAPGGRFPCAWGPIDATTTPNATGRDFGNWFPARLQVTKRLFPAADPGRFDLLVDGQAVVEAGGDGASATVSLPPGSHTVAERAAAGTSLADYRSAVSCRSGVTRFEALRVGTSYEDLPLAAGQLASCTFVNVGPGQPAIAISKRGPAIAAAGDTLRYGLEVTNPGDIAFAAVTVTDRGCDDPPRIVSKRGDATPGTLDPGDAWRYGCKRETAAGKDCEPSSLPNSAAVTGATGDITVRDEDEIATILRCPDQPSPVPPDPPGPEPISPPGPEPPPAGDSGVAGIIAQRGCLGARIPRVALRGTRIGRLRMYVDGAFAGSVTPGVLQRAHRPRVALAPGRRYRVRMRVIFQPGSGTPPVTISRVIRTCAQPGSACAPAAGGARAACAAALRAPCAPASEPTRSRAGSARGRSSGRARCARSARGRARTRP